MSRNKKRKLKRSTKQMIIVFISAIIVAFAATIIAQLLEKPYNVYYPHDEERIIQEQPE